MGIQGEEVQAERASEADAVALAAAHEVCVFPGSSLEEVTEAIDQLITSVEEGYSLANQIDSALGAAFSAGALDTPEMAVRVAALENMAIFAARIRQTPFELLLTLAHDSQPQVAAAARATLRKGPLDRSEAERWETALALLAPIGAEGTPEEKTAQVVETLAAIFS